MASDKQLSKKEIAEIFRRTAEMYPNLLVNSTGEKYTVDHPASEGLATIFKIKLDEFDRLQQQIEEGKRKCLAAAGCKSVQDLLKRRPMFDDSRRPSAPRMGDFMEVGGNVADSHRPSVPTLGDFMKVTKRNRKHK